MTPTKEQQERVNNLITTDYRGREEKAKFLAEILRNLVDDPTSYDSYLAAIPAALKR